MKKVECKCPNCKKLHIQSFCWSKPYRPWIYCNKCEKISKRYPDHNYAKLHLDALRNFE